MDIIKFYSEKLTELKPDLGRSFISDLNQLTGNQGKWKVRDAFAGKCADLKYLKQVHEQAVKIARKNINAKAEAAKMNNEVKDSAKRVA